VSHGPVLITGGSGLLAMNWACEIRRERSVVLGLHSRRIELSGVKSIVIDLESVDAIIRAIDLVKPEFLVHAAGMTSVEKCETDLSQAFQVNAHLTNNVARACQQRRISLIHISTDHLFAGTKPNTTEVEPVSPVNVYGRSKALAEQYVATEHPKALIVRTNFYGWGTTYRESFSDRIVKSLREGRVISLFSDVFFTPIVSSMVARISMDLVAAGGFGVFNVSGDDRVSKYDFGVSLANIFGLDSGLIRPGRLGDVPGLISRPLDMSLSNSAATKFLGRSLGGVEKHLRILLEQEKSFSEELKRI
jgi:dTDP-4-dehydrorhamnose reductase